jgi:2-haloacid dehalogenase
MSLENEVKALFFDVFGTCVDWRSTVTTALVTASSAAIKNPGSHIPISVIDRASKLTEDDWGILAQQWRNTYKVFVKSLAADESLRWKTVDQHHLEALIDLVKTWQIENLWSNQELQQLSLIWHNLDPWSDSVHGMELLNKKFKTSTLSNGNISLLKDLKEHSRIPFTDITSSEEFQSYKPSPKVYLGAVKKFGLEPSQVAMVAAHLNDLKAAKSYGLRTIYVERPKEEDWDDTEVEESKHAGFVDLWVDGSEKGFEAVARKLNIL